ncbi:MAG TPA: SRPBCC family protein [Rhizomicrobium sp.]|jgi:choline monooxygenase|nr:SRPBCC family protein [Rhizomicrobium sp.]
MQIPAATTLSASLYRDPAVFETERRHVFAKNWLLFAHESQMETPGAYVAQAIAGYPLIAVRGEDGQIRAFHNVCRHRAGPLADDGTGKCEKQLVCRYHGWRYALDGRLANARDFGPAAGFDPRDYALWPVACQIWRGFIFVNLDKDAAPLAEFLKPLDEKARGIDLESFRFARHSMHEIACNWKTYVENYLEGYHIPLIHPGLNGAVDSAHYSVEVEPPAIFHRAPPRDGAPVAGLWAWLWPCLGINVYTGGLMMERMWPLGHDRTRLDYLYFFPKDASQAQIDKAMESSEATTAEDVYITQAVQRNLNAGIYDVGRLSPKHEGGVSWFQREVARSLGN